MQPFQYYRRNRRSSCKLLVSTVTKKNLKQCLKSKRTRDQKTLTNLKQGIYLSKQLKAWLDR